MPLLAVRRGRAAVALAVVSTVVAAACAGDSLSAPNRVTQSNESILYTAFDYATGRASTFAILPDGSGKVAIGSTSGDEVGPVPSPDGSRIAVVRLVDTLPQVFVMDADGTNAHLAATVLGGAFWPSWTPDGGAIMFSNYGELKTWMMNADGSNPHRVVDGADDEQLPALSPDGRRIVFTSARQFSETFRVYELFMMNVDGTNVRRLTSSPELTHGYNVYPRWSPDGKRIAFIRSIDDSVAHVFVVDADGTGLRQMTFGDLSDLGVAWSLDGQRLAVARELMGGFGDIYVTSANDATHLVNITNTLAVDERYPSWGKRVGR